MSDLLPIGRFAQASRLSIKALRRYDADGLLVPAHVDPDSGYRYYTRDQVRRATAIALLRSLDVPLATIRGVLDAPDPRAALASERARAERELERRRRNLRALERLLGAAAVLPYAVALAEQPALRLGGVSGEVRAETIGADVEPLAEAALARAAAEGWTQDDGLVGVYPLELTDPCTVATGSRRWRRCRAASRRRRCPSAATTSSRSPTRPCSAGRTSTATSRAARCSRPTSTTRAPRPSTSWRRASPCCSRER